MSVPALRFKGDNGQDFPEWEEKEIGDVFKVTRGNVLAMSLVSEAKTDANQYPVYSSQTKNNGLSGYFNEYLYESSITWTTDGANAGDVNFRSGKFYCTNVCGVLVNDKGYANTCIAAMINAVSRRYVSYVGNPKLMNGVMAKIVIGFPCLKEQTKIANFLAAVDEKIIKITKKHELLTQYKKGVMQKIFSQELRFKDDDGNEFPEWEEKKVGDVFKVTRGNVLAMSLVSEAKTDRHQYPVYSSQTKNNGLTGYFNEYLYESSITWTTDGANAGDVNFRAGKFYCTNVCGVLINKDGHANACIAAMINAVSRKYVSYVGNPKLMNGVMAKIAIRFPCVEEQNKVANFLATVDKKITNTQAELEAVKQYKQGLLQKMFV